MWKAVGALCVALALFCAGCTDGTTFFADCELEDVFCDGAVAHNCAEFSGKSIPGRSKYEEDCGASGQVCFVVTDEAGTAREAVCAINDEPCAGSSAACDGDNLLMCRGAVDGQLYLRVEERCADLGNTCLEDDQTVTCARDAEPCDIDTHEDACEGDLAINCVNGYVKITEDCSGDAATSCRVENGNASCWLN